MAFMAGIRLDDRTWEMTAMNIITKLVPEAPRVYVAPRHGHTPLVLREHPGHRTASGPLSEPADELPATLGLPIELHSYPQGIRELASPLSD